jgi:hypothetical protein
MPMTNKHDGSTNDIHWYVLINSDIHLQELPQLTPMVDSSANSDVLIANGRDCARYSTFFLSITTQCLN